MKWHIGIAVIILLMYGGIVLLLDSTTEDSSANTKSVIKEALERAYFEGQIDAIRGDVRVKQNSDGCWEWTKSPWDDLKESVKFKPVCY